VKPFNDLIVVLLRPTWCDANFVIIPKAQKTITPIVITPKIEHRASIDLNFKNW